MLVETEDVGADITALVHAIGGRSIPEPVREVVAILQRAGFPTFLVGGCLRDGALGQGINDFDIVTTASPLAVYRCFDDVSLVGRRHRLALVTHRGLRLEVSPMAAGAGEHLAEIIARDIHTRDFTINALYFDPIASTIQDPCGGLQDLASRQLRTIDKAAASFARDPVRIYRGLRLASKLGLALHHDIASALPFASLARDAESCWRSAREFTAMCRSGTLVSVLRQLNSHGALARLLPTVNGAQLASPHALAVLEAIAHEPKPERLPGVFIAALVWPVVQAQLGGLASTSVRYHEAVDDVLRAQQGILRMFIDAHDGWCRSVLSMRIAEARGR